MMRKRVPIVVLAIALVTAGCAKRADTVSANASPTSSGLVAALASPAEHDDHMGKMLRFDARKSQELTTAEKAFLTKVNHSMFRVKPITNLKIQLDTTELQVIVSDPEWSQASEDEQKKAFTTIATDWQKRCIAYQRAVQPKAPLIAHCNTAIIGQSGTTYKHG